MSVTLPRPELNYNTICTWHHNGILLQVFGSDSILEYLTKQDWYPSHEWFIIFPRIMKDDVKYNYMQHNKIMWDVIIYDYHIISWQILWYTFIHEKLIREMATVAGFIIYIHTWEINQRNGYSGISWFPLSVYTARHYTFAYGVI